MEVLTAEPVAPEVTARYGWLRRDRVGRFARAHWVDIAWVVFIARCTASACGG